ncbi:conserved hypothetical protein [Ricinus communis]|uniref:Uncharacterized protein n=1 Tax=Ricinus communis TaxID=3988 RepID=B9T3H0_RICCO|nr:conserved hypothetical protein [Ricinus communis]
MRDKRKKIYIQIGVTMNLEYVLPQDEEELTDEADIENKEEEAIHENEDDVPYNDATTRISEELYIGEEYYELDDNYSIENDSRDE